MTGARIPIQRPQGQWRFNWDSPFLLSPHNPRVLYFAGNRVFRSLMRGRQAEVLSEDLGATPQGTATALAESPLRPGLLYVGTDEGTLWRSKDGGANWEALHPKLTAMPGPRYVSCIHPSHHQAERVYLSFDGHRSGDFGANVYVSEDAGDTWTSLRGNLPDEPVHVCRDLPAHRAHGANANLLVLGTEFGCYVSFDRGQQWLRLGEDLPTVAVRDLVLQSRDSELIAATHGRGLFALDVSALRQIGDEVVGKRAHLFQPELLIHWRMRSRGHSGHKEWSASNPPAGVPIHVWFADAPGEPPVVTIHDVTGNQVASATGRAVGGIQVIRFDGRAGSPPAADGERRGRRGGGGPPGGGRQRNLLPAGSYSVRLQTGGTELVQPLTIVEDPIATAPSAAVSVPAQAPEPLNPNRSQDR
jgi:hypothetical protein